MAESTAMSEPTPNVAEAGPGITPDVPIADPISDALAHAGLGRGTRMAIGGLGLLLGLASVVVGTAGMPDGTAIVRAAFVAVGLGLGYAGLAIGARAYFGRPVRVGLWLSAAWLVILAIVTALADVLPLSESRNVGAAIDEPILQRPDLFSAHPLGTDRHGLDLLGGVIYGARVSLIVGLGAVGAGVLIGGLIGLLAGYYRGRLDAVASFFADSLLAFPPLILLLALMAVLDPSVRNVTLGLAVLGIPIYIRIARANTMALAERDFVVAARVLGSNDRRLLLREILPNVAPMVLSYAFVVVAVMIVAEASLSYLGLSVQRPEPTWGNMIAAGQDSFDRHPHLVFVPGVVLFVTVLALNHVGEAARVAWSSGGSSGGRSGR